MAASSFVTVYMGRSDVADRLEEHGGLTISDPNQTKDKTTTIYRLKTKNDARRVQVQFGKSMEDWVGCSVVNYADPNDSSMSKRVVFANADKDPQVATDVEKLIAMIGEKIYAGREAYYNGRVSSDMSLKDFQERCSVVLKRNRLTDVNEVQLKCRPGTRMTPASKFWMVKDLVKDEATGRYSCKRIPISKFTSTSRSFDGLISCSVGVYTGWNKGPTWGVFFTILDACLLPIEGRKRSSGDEGGDMLDMFGMDVQTEADAKMVIASSMDLDHEAGSEDEEAAAATPQAEVAYISPKQKRSRTN